MDAVEEVVQQIAAFCNAGKYSPARRLAARTLVQHPHDAQLWRLHAHACYFSGDFGSAAESYSRAATYDALAARDQCRLAECYLSTKRESLARLTLKRLFASADCPTDVLPALAAGFARAGDDDMALEACRLAAAREPAKPEPLIGVAYYLKKLGYPPGVAVPAVSKALQLAPGNVLYQCLLAFLLGECGRTEEAYDLLRDVGPASVTCPCQLRRMMAIFQVRGDYDRWSACRKALSTHRDSGD